MALASIGLAFLFYYLSSLVAIPEDFEPSAFTVGATRFPAVQFAYWVKTSYSDIAVGFLLLASIAVSLLIIAHPPRFRILAFGGIIASVGLYAFILNGQVGLGPVWLSRLAVYGFGGPFQYGQVGFLALVGLLLSLTLLWADKGIGKAFWKGFVWGVCPLIALHQFILMRNPVEYELQVAQFVASFQINGISILSNWSVLMLSLAMPLFELARTRWK